MGHCAAPAIRLNAASRGRVFTARCAVRQRGEGGVPMHMVEQGAVPKTAQRIGYRTGSRGRSRRHKPSTARGVYSALAERAGFEPAEVLPSHDFQSCALGRTMLPLLASGRCQNYTILVPGRQIRLWPKVCIREGVFSLLFTPIFRVRRLKFRDFGRILSLMTCQDGGIGV